VWKSSMSEGDHVISRGITEAIMSGLAGTIEALSEPEDAQSKRHCEGTATVPISLCFVTMSI
jgi:hypothetical protein